MTLAQRYAGAIVRARWAVVGGWGILLLALSVSLPTLESSGSTGGFRGFAEPGNPAIAAEIRSFEKFGVPVLTRTAVVVRNPEGLPPATQLRVLTAALDFNLNRPPELRRIEFALPLVNDSRLLPTREDGTTAITYLYYRPDVSFGRQTGLAAEYAQRYLGDPGRSDSISVTGVIPARVAQLVILRRTLDTVELATIGLILLVVAINFRAVVAPLITLATAGLALGLIVRLAGWLGGQLGFDVPKEIEPVMVALLLGIVTDYSIFFLSGMKDRLDAGDPSREAAVSSTTEFAPIILVAGLTVAAGSLALLTAQVGLFRTFGPGMAVTILLSLVVAVTFVPASIAILGRATFWPARFRPSRSEMMQVRRRTRLVAALTRKRVAAIALVVGGVALLAAAAPLRQLDLGFGVVSSLPASYEARRGAEDAGRGFWPGVLSPTVLLLEGPDLNQQRPQLAQLQAKLASRPGISTVAGPASLPSQVTVGAVLANTGDAARYVLVFSSDPLGARAVSELHTLRQEMPALLAEAGLRQVKASFAGDTALAEVTVSQTEADLPRVVLVAAALGFGLLVIFLRALVAPVCLTVINVLAVSCALGLTTFAFLTVAGHGGLTFYVPFAAAVLLIALGADYSIFGVGYIWAEARNRPLLDAIRVAVPRSTRAIGAAGITLALSFAILATVPLRPFREFAFAMSIGILLDVFVVRSFLVPSVITLLGPAGGWPGRALRQRAPPDPATAVSVPAAAPPPPRAGTRPPPAWVTAVGAVAVVLRLLRGRTRRRSSRRPGRG